MSDVCVCMCEAHFEVALIGVENDSFVSVEDSLHFHSESADGRLEIRLFGVHHQPNAIFHRMLFSTRGAGGELKTH